MGFQPCDWHSSRSRGHPHPQAGGGLRAAGTGSQAGAGSAWIYFISGWPLTGVDLLVGRGEGSKRGIKGTLPCLPFKQQLAQHSSTARGSLWLRGFMSSASLGPGQGCGAPLFSFFKQCWGFNRWHSSCRDKACRAAGVSDVNLGSGRGSLFSAGAGI